MTYYSAQLRFRGVRLSEWVVGCLLDGWVMVSTVTLLSSDDVSGSTVGLCGERLMTTQFLP